MEGDQTHVGIIPILTKAQMGVSDYLGNFRPQLGEIKKGDFIPKSAVYKLAKRLGVVGVSSKSGGKNKNYF